MSSTEKSFSETASSDETTISTASSSFANLDRVKEEVDAELVELKEKANELKKTEKELRAQVEELEAQLAEVQTTTTAQTTQAEALQTQLDEQQAKAQTSAERAAKLEETIAALEAERDKLREEHRARLKMLRELAEAANSSLTEGKASADFLEATNELIKYDEEGQKQRDILLEMIDAALAKKELADAARDAAMERARELEAQLAEAKKNLEVSATAQAGTSEELARLQAELATATAARDGAEAKLAQRERDNVAWLQKVQGVIQEIAAALEDDLSASTASSL